MRFVCSVLLILVMASVSSPAWAQTQPRLDPSATRRAVAAAAAGPHQMSRADRLVRDTIIGAVAGVVTGGLLWAVTRDCNTCGPGPGHAMLTTGAFGATAGAWVGIVQGWGAGRHPDIRIGRHLAVDPTVSPSRVGGAVKIRL